MCTGIIDGNKILTCTVGDLQPGQTFRLPASKVGPGWTAMVLNLPAPSGETYVADHLTGQVVTLTSTVGNLQPGQRYRTPDGHTLMVCNQPRGNDTTVVDTADGTIQVVASAVKLGHDRHDRLYASRYLNPMTPDTVVVPAV